MVRSPNVNDAVRAEPAAALAELTRTCLRLEHPLDTSLAQRAAAALRRVPGVLLAEAGTASGDVRVTHDAAVELAALLAAVQSAGCNVATVVRAEPAPPTELDAAVRRELLRRRRLTRAGLVLLSTILLVEFFVPNVPSKEWLLVALAIPAWTFYFFDLQSRRLRRRKRT